MSQLTTHILDTSAGKPAEGVTVTLFCEQAALWKEMAKGITNADGRIPDLLKKEAVLEQGTYKLRFDTRAYFDKNRVATFYPYVEIIFTITSAAHYHVPLLLNPFGYSTYRGS